MIEDLDASLKAMLAGEAAAGSTLATAGISFAAPDPTWQGQGSGLQVDIYLYRVMDNRELRSNQRTTVLNPDGSVTTSLFPARVECSYIITAWEKGSDVAGIDKEISEHALLGEVLYVLWRNPVLPGEYLAGSLVNPELPLPVIAAESEDMAAKPDFWSALDTYVRPGRHLPGHARGRPGPGRLGPAGDDDPHDPSAGRCPGRGVHRGRRDHPQRLGARADRFRRLGPARFAGGEHRLRCDRGLPPRQREPGPAQPHRARRRLRPRGQDIHRARSQRFLRRQPDSTLR